MVGKWDSPLEMGTNWVGSWFVAKTACPSPEREARPLYLNTVAEEEELVVAEPGRDVMGQRKKGMQMGICFAEGKQSTKWEKVQYFVSFLTEPTAQTYP